MITLVFLPEEGIQGHGFGYYNRRYQNWVGMIEDQNY